MKWTLQRAVMEAEAHWKHQETVGIVCQGCLWLGNYQAKRWGKAGIRDRRGLVVQRVREAAEDDQQMKAVGPASVAVALMRGATGGGMTKSLWQSSNGKRSKESRTIIKHLHGEPSISSGTERKVNLKPCLPSCIKHLTGRCKLK